VSWTCRAGHALRNAAGHSSCGDATFAWMEGERGLFAVVDALGHGLEAAASAQLTTRTLASSLDRTLAQAIQECDRALREGHQRGVALSAIQVRAGAMIYAGIGDVQLYGPPGAKRPPNTPGVVGRGLREVREWELQVTEGQRWVLASDGIRRREATAAIRDVAGVEPEEAAQRILLAAGRTDDDASVLVLDWGRR